MHSDKFYYSKWFGWWPYVYSAVWVPMDYYRNLNMLHYHHGRLFANWEIGFFVLIAVFLVYHFFRYILPMLTGKVFVEVDGEKVSYYHKSKTIYWRDVTKVYYGDLSNAVILKLSNKKRIRIYLRCVSGDDSEILKSFSAHFRQAGEPGEPFVVTVG